MEDSNWLSPVYGGIETSQTLAGDFGNAIRDEIDFDFLEARIKRDCKFQWTVGEDFLAVPLDLNHDVGGALADEAFQDDLGLPGANRGEESTCTGAGKGLGESVQVGQVEIFDNK